MHFVEFLVPLWGGFTCSIVVNPGIELLLGMGVFFQNKYKIMKYFESAVIIAIPFITISRDFIFALVQYFIFCGIIQTGDNFLFGVLI